MPETLTTDARKWTRADVERALRERDAELPSLRGADLTGCDLHGLDLSTVDFTGARLAFCNLEGATLFRAKVDQCELSGAALGGADLSECSAVRAGLGAARLDAASLRGADLRGATLSQASLRGADLSGARLEDARLRNADLTDALLIGADLRHVDLCGGQLRGASLRNANLRNGRLTAIRGFVRADWIGADVRDVDFCGAYLARRHIVDENYLDEFRRRGRGSELVYRIWWLTSDCGRSMVRWSVFTLLTALLFAGAFVFVDVDFGAHHTVLSPLYFSFVTMTTLGYGDVVPASCAAQTLCALEALFGYIALGGLLSIFANKMALRGE